MTSDGRDRARGRVAGVAADPRRLGKRGAYRLGRLAAPPPVPQPPPAPHYPSWVPGRRGPATVWVVGCLAGAALIAAGAMAGWWFVPFAAGLAAGLANRYGRWRAWVAVPAVAVVAAAGWAAPLAWASVNGVPERGAARVAAILAGLPPHGSLVLAATLGAAAVQAVCGYWLGRALTPHPPWRR